MYSTKIVQNQSPIPQFFYAYHYKHDTGHICHITNYNIMTPINFNYAFLTGCW